MLGLKLIHVSKRGHMYQGEIDYFELIVICVPKIEELLFAVGLGHRSKFVILSMECMIILTYYNIAL